MWCVIVGWWYYFWYCLKLIVSPAGRCWPLPADAQFWVPRRAGLGRLVSSLLLQAPEHPTTLSLRPQKSCWNHFSSLNQMHHQLPIWFEPLVTAGRQHQEAPLGLGTLWASLRHHHRCHFYSPNSHPAPHPLFNLSHQQPDHLLIIHPIYSRPAQGLPLPIQPIVVVEWWPALQLLHWLADLHLLISLLFFVLWHYRRTMMVSFLGSDVELHHSCFRRVRPNWSFRHHAFQCFARLTACWKCHPCRIRPGWNCSHYSFDSTSRPQLLLEEQIDCYSLPHLNQTISYHSYQFRQLSLLAHIRFGDQFEFHNYLHP